MKDAMNEIFNRLVDSGLTESKAHALIGKFLEQEAESYYKEVKSIEAYNRRLLEADKIENHYENLIEAMVKRGFDENEAHDLFIKAHKEASLVDDFYEDLATIMEQEDQEEEDKVLS